MAIDTRDSNGVAILDLHGKINIGEATKELRASVREVLDKGDKKILLNLGDVTMIDSAGIGELVRSYTTVTNAGGQLKLVGLTQHVKQILVITKLLTVFDSFDDEATAVGSFA